MTEKENIMMMKKMYDDSYWDWGEKEYYSNNNDVDLLFDVLFKSWTGTKEDLIQFYKLNIHHLLNDFSHESQTKIIKKLAEHMSITELSEFLDEDSLIKFIKRHPECTNKNDVIKMFNNFDSETIIEILTYYDKFSTKDITKYVEKYIKETGVAIFDTDFSRKNGVRGNLYKLFNRVCTSEKVFDFWVGKKKIKGDIRLNVSLNSENDFSYFEKVLNCGIGFDIKLKKI